MGLRRRIGGWDGVTLATPIFKVIWKGWGGSRLAEAQNSAPELLRRLNWMYLLVDPDS